MGFTETFDPRRNSPRTYRNRSPCACRRANHFFFNILIQALKAMHGYYTIIEVKRDLLGNTDKF